MTSLKRIMKYNVPANDAEIENTITEYRCLKTASSELEVGRDGTVVSGSGF